MNSTMMNRTHELSIGDWINRNVREIEDGTARYEGVPISKETKIRRFHSCISFLLVTTRQSSELVLDGTPECDSTRFRCLIVTALCGWWSIFGIVYAPVYLLKNLAGGDVMTVEDCLYATERYRSFMSGSSSAITIGKIFAAIFGLIFLAGVGMSIFAFIKTHFGH